jgi:hypothetical protein
MAEAVKVPIPATVVSNNRLISSGSRAARSCRLSVRTFRPFKCTTGDFRGPLIVHDVILVKVSGQAASGLQPVLGELCIVLKFHDAQRPAGPEAT